MPPRRRSRSPEGLFHGAHPSRQNPNPDLRNRRFPNTGRHPRPWLQDYRDTRDEAARDNRRAVEQRRQHRDRALGLDLHRNWRGPAVQNTRNEIARIRQEIRDATPTDRSRQFEQSIRDRTPRTGNYERIARENDLADLQDQLHNHIHNLRALGFDEHPDPDFEDYEGLEGAGSTTTFHTAREEPDDVDIPDAEPSYFDTLNGPEEQEAYERHLQDRYVEQGRLQGPADPYGRETITRGTGREGEAAYDSLRGVETFSVHPTTEAIHLEPALTEQEAGEIFSVDLLGDFQGLQAFGNAVGLQGAGAPGAAQAIGNSTTFAPFAEPVFTAAETAAALAETADAAAAAASTAAAVGGLEASASALSLFAFTGL